MFSAMKGMGRVARVAPSRAFSASPRVQSKVAVLGAAGGIGQPLSLLLKNSPLITEVRLYDVQGTPGVAADLSHISTLAKVLGTRSLEEALREADVVIIPAGVPRKPGMTRDDLFNVNASIVRDLAAACTKYCPNALVGVISNPVNSTVPIFAEVAKLAGTYDKRKLFGVTTLDIVRANTFVAAARGLDVNKVTVPVIGGHSGITILPLLSQASPSVTFTDDEVAKLTDRIQNAGTEVVEAKAGAGSATLSMAYAGAQFTFGLLEGLSGKSGVVQCTFVESDVVPGVQYFASKVEMTRNGAGKIHPPGKLSAFEKAQLDKLIPVLKTNIQTGIDFVKQRPPTF